MTKLTLADIADLRAYEATRDAFRSQVIALKKIRRVPVGPVISLTFENAATIRFQIQEMARAEKILSDARIDEELTVYNPLIPDPGELSATLFIELTSKDEMFAWLPKLVGIERSVEFRLGEPGSPGGARTVVRCTPEESHGDALTREEVTAAVHYVHFAFTADEVELFATGPVTLAVDHPEYQHALELAEETRAALLEDLRHGG